MQEQQASPSVNGYSRTGEGDLTAGQPTGIPSESGGHVRGRRWIIFAGIDLLVPFAVFAARVGTWTLNPFAAPRMLRYDWVTYISAPNFLRSAPLLTFPLGRTPDYMAPVGSSLGLADASPFMLPLYRLLNVISPDHPTQILGLLVLASYVLTYYWSVKFLRRAYVALRGQAPSLLVDVEIRVAGVLLLLLPVFTSRISHVALTQQWILVAALYCALFCRQVSGRNDRYVVAVCLGAAVLHPYFVVPVVAISAPYLFRRLRHEWRRGLVLGGVIAGGIIGIGFVLGYLAVGTSTTNAGYGDYSADLAFLVNPQGSSSALPDIPYAPDTWEGIGFVGLGVLIVLVAAAAAILCRRSTFRPSRTVVAVSIACIVLALFAAWPTIHFAGHTLVDLSGGPFSLEFVGNVFRTNGRFVWSLTWLVALGVCAVVVAARWPALLGLGVLVAATVVQLVDGEQFKFLDRGSADYQQVAGLLLDEKSRGATSVQVQPPWIQYACVPLEIPFDDLAPVLLAAAVWELPINSGYPGRPAPDFGTEICWEQANEFATGVYEPDVLYVVNRANAAVGQLSCRPLLHDLVACRVAS